MIKQGTYKPPIQGVSQQTAQDRSDGQLGEQINMLSDPVTGLRRRSGTKFINNLDGAIQTDYINNFYMNGQNLLTTINIYTGVLRIFSLDGRLLYASPETDYFKCTDAKYIRTTVVRDTLMVVNTTKVPTTVSNTTAPNPKTMGYFGIMGTALSKKFRVTLTVNNVKTTVTYTTSDSSASGSYPIDVANALTKSIREDDTLKDKISVYNRENIVGLVAKSGNVLNSVDTDSTESYVITSRDGYLTNKTYLVSKLPSQMNNYIMGIGVAGNRSYFQYDYKTNTWSECGAYGTSEFYVKDEPMYVSVVKDVYKLQGLGIQGRIAGDDDNNPLPKFINYGITGISAYQSRLLILSGGYVNFSKSSEYNVFLRTTVEEVKDDDPIEISSASLSSTQFEYAIPYNKDLVLIAQDQQAVIPSNSTVLTPRNAVIYPSSYTDVSLRTAPTAIARSLYYVYQRGTDYYQVGELIPNSYTDAQYYSQGLTDHIPLYAKGVCTHIAGSTTNNMVVFSSDTDELLVHQFLWSGDTRPQMAFHKWGLPLIVKHTFLVSDQMYIVLLADDGALWLVINDIKINQLDTKPQPYLDLYSYVNIKNGVGTLPDHLKLGFNVVGVIYDNTDMRHKEVQLTIDGTIIKCPYDGVIAVGLRYLSSFTLTPPFLKDENGTILAGVDAQLKDVKFTYKNSGDYDFAISDQYGTSNKQSTTAMIWSQVRLEHTWIGAQLQEQIDCRTDLTSTKVTVNTTSTTELNPISVGYTLRVARKHR